MKLGILRETKIPVDNRVPLSPEQCREIQREFPDVKIFVQSSENRCFKDEDYLKKGISINNDLRECDVLIGIKEVNVNDLIPEKTYLFFSHTTKKQPHNKILLKAILDKNIRLIDYEKLSDSEGIRIVGFGRWAGLIGTFLAIRALCIHHHLPGLSEQSGIRRLDSMMKQASAVHLPPVRIALTGDGRVASGSEEMLTAFGVQKVSVEDYFRDKSFGMPVYVQLDPEKYNKNKFGNDFSLPHFFSSPAAYESNFCRFCDKTDILIMAAYWDPNAPKLFTEAQMKQQNFSIRIIADITCDIHGSIPSSIRTTSFKEPYYDFNPFLGKEEAAFSNPANITVMAIDNLPTGLPVEASVDFGHNLMKYVLPLLINGDSENTLTRATIAEEGKLTTNYQYLFDWVNQQD